MTRLIISDVHADIRALDAIMEIAGDPSFIDRYGEVTGVISLGDAVERGFHPEEVVERLLTIKDEKSLVSVVGNHDEALLYGRGVTGSDITSTDAHAGLRENQRCMRFLKSLPQHQIDDNDRILAVHGGPIDPSTIPGRKLSDDSDWLYQRTWQRISEAGRDFFDFSGYHYTPEHAFGYTKEAFGSGLLILCGHEHSEACYSETSGLVTDILPDMTRRRVLVSGRVIHTKAMVRQEGVNYLVRVGIAGPEGYARYGWNTSYFGLLWEHEGIDWVGLFSFEL